MAESCDGLCIAVSPERGGSWPAAGTRGWTRVSCPRGSLAVAGKVLEKGQGLKELLSIPNSAMVVAVEPHESGTWSVTVGWWQTLHIPCPPSEGYSASQALPGVGLLPSTSSWAEDV